MQDSRFETRRFEMRPVRPQDHAELGAVFLSNAAFTALTSEAPGESLETELGDGREREGCFLLVITERESGRVAGLLNLLGANPRDGHPWLGLLILHAEFQGAGVGREVAEGLFRLGHARVEGPPFGCPGSQPAGPPFLGIPGLPGGGVPNVCLPRRGAAPSLPGARTVKTKGADWPPSFLGHSGIGN